METLPLELVNKIFYYLVQRPFIREITDICENLDMYKHVSKQIIYNIAIKKLNIFYQNVEDTKIRYYVAYEIGNLLGYSDIYPILNNMVSENNILIFKDYNGIRETSLDQQTILINQKGIKELIVTMPQEISDKILQFINNELDNNFKNFISDYLSVHPSSQISVL